ncbi:MAG: ion channel [Pirellula sp.]|jgi:hypothetical protein|nr:ion channel [Pirellula sp.]
MVTAATVGYGDITPVTTLGRSITMFTFVTALAIPAWDHDPAILSNVTGSPPVLGLTRCIIF